MMTTMMMTMMMIMMMMILQPPLLHDNADDDDDSNACVTFRLGNANQMVTGSRCRGGIVHIPGGCSCVPTL